MLVLLASLGLALAQTGPTSGVELNSQLWRPTIDGTPTLWANDAHMRPMLYGGAKFVVSYVHRPFVYTYGNGAEVAMVNDAVQADAIGSLSLGPIRIGVDVPVFMLATSDVAEGGAGLGDLVLDVKGTLLEPSTAPIGIALATRVALPTGNTGIALSDPGLGWEIEGIFDKPIGDVRLLLNVGTRVRPTVELDNAVLDDQIYGRLGLGWFLSENVGLSADVGGQANYSDKLTNAAAVPVEGILGGWARIPETPVVLRAGGGTGLVNGVGAPASRFIFTVSYEPPEVRDRDLDGLVDRIDECPSDPEDFDQFEDEDGCPELDNDGDGLADTEDACPNDPEDFDEWLDSDGCPEPEVPVHVRVIEPSGSSIASANTRVSGEYGGGYDGGEFTIPMVAGTYELRSTADGFSDGSASVTVDAMKGGEAVIQLTPHIPLGDLLIVVTGPDGARIANATFSANGGGDLDIASDAMKMRPGDYEFLITAEGYKPVSRPGTIRDGEVTTIEVQLAPARVVVTRTRIDLSEKVYFDTNKATIKAESFGLLDEVATVLMDHPELLRIRIEGHTDSRGSDKYNLDLSAARAASVLDYLVSKGVEAERLESEGFGETKPLDTKQNAKAWEMNRRVDIFITERAED